MSLFILKYLMIVSFARYTFLGVNPYLIITSLLLAVLSCWKPTGEIKDTLEKNLLFSGKNRKELEKVISHFQQDRDSLKLKAAILLLSNIEDKTHYGGKWLDEMDSMFFNRAGHLGEEGLRRLRDTVFERIGKPKISRIKKIYDLKFLSSSFLIQNIEDAYDTWQNARWKSSVTFDAFCNYILPYKVYNEYPEEWRAKLRARYSYILDDSDVPWSMEDICCAMVDEEKKWLDFTYEHGGHPGALSISLIDKLQKGSCTEWSEYGADAARAFAIPVAIDYTPQYGNRFTTHHWNALILSDTKFLSFLGAESRPGDHAAIREGESKFAKVFRCQLNPNPESFAFKARKAGIADVPVYLEDPRIQDVTGSYTMVSDLRFDLKDGVQGRPLYLCIFKNWDWEAIAGGFVDQGSVLFPRMGRAILYQPMYYMNGHYQSAGPPVGLMADNSFVEFQARQQDFEDMILKRKYPFKRTDEWLRENPLLNARFEGDNNPDFSKPNQLYTIHRNQRPYRGSRLNNLAIKDHWAYDSLWREVPVLNQDSFRFLRLVLPKENPFMLGEIEFYAPGTDQPLKGKYIGNVSQSSLAFDGFPGKCIKLPKDTSLTRWVGLDLGKRMALKKIRFIPADDDNFVEVGKTYELFYWRDKWISAGEKKAVADTIEYKKVPKGGIYLLRCWNCNNREERPFTYENGKQTWW